MPGLHALRARGSLPHHSNSYRHTRQLPAGLRQYVQCAHLERINIGQLRDTQCLYSLNLSEE